MSLNMNISLYSLPIITFPLVLMNLIQSWSVFLILNFNWMSLMGNGKPIVSAVIILGPMRKSTVSDVIHIVLRIKYVLCKKRQRFRFYCGWY